MRVVCVLIETIFLSSSATSKRNLFLAELMQNTKRDKIWSPRRETRESPAKVVRLWSTIAEEQSLSRNFPTSGSGASSSEVIIRPRCVVFSQ